MATNGDYKKENYDQILVRVKKGKKEEYKQAADDFGLGQMELFRIAVEEYIQNHGGEVMKPEKPESISAADKRLIDEFNRLPVDARKHFLQAFKAINEDKPAPIVDAREDKKLNSE